MKRRKHIACRIGDHSGRPARDIAPDRTPITLFTDDGKVWLVADLDSRMIQAARRCARRDGVSVNLVLSAAVVEGFNPTRGKRLLTGQFVPPHRVRSSRGVFDSNGPNTGNSTRPAGPGCRGAGLDAAPPRRARVNGHDTHWSY